MSSEELVIKVRKRKGEDRRVVLEFNCTRSLDKGGIAHSYEDFNPDEDMRRVKDSQDFKSMMKKIEAAVADLICMQLY